MKKSRISNRDCVNQLNAANGVSEAQRQDALQLFRQSGNSAPAQLIDEYLASMNQDLDSAWLAQRPASPAILRGKVPGKAEERVDILGIGGMFAYLNVLYQAHKNGGRHCIVTNPRAIFTFSGWTMHPEEDMDQRLIEMFQTKSMVINEVKRLLGLSENPWNIRFKSFKIDYEGMLNLVRNPGELMKNMKVALHYSLLELTDREKRHAKINLRRNTATLKALAELGLIGEDSGRHVANLCGRVVFEIEDETKVEAKKILKEQFGLGGTRLTASGVEAMYGAKIGITAEIRSGSMSAVRYPGGHFITGHKETALRAAKEKNVLVYDDATVSEIIVDSETGKHAVTFKRAGGKEKTVVADVVLMALGDYGKDIIIVDGISTLFAVITEDSGYKIHPSGMGEGGTIHVVPVWSLPVSKAGKTLYCHLGKATNGAIMGRNPRRPKSLARDRDFMLHLEANLKRISPPGATFLWIAATECGRPVSAYQGYSIEPLLKQEKHGRYSPAGSILNFQATGGCGLGGNTAIIPEVQEILDRRYERRNE